VDRSERDNRLFWVAAEKVAAFMVPEVDKGICAGFQGDVDGMDLISTFWTPLPKNLISSPRVLHAFAVVGGI
jgi:hypothetical protein